ncbi:MAG: hypothetical protein Q7S66_03650 [bacterium]|nr:hypothetical protein [bacterium]
MSGTKKIIIAGVVIFGLMIFGSMAPFLPQLLSFLPFYSSSTQIDSALEKAFKEKFGSTKLPPVAQITYTEVPDSVKQTTVDCDKLDIVPKQFRGAKYYCQNIYLTDSKQLKTQVGKTKPERILLYGQYSYYDCPVSSPAVSDMIDGCWKAAKFLDNWQIPQMIRVLGVKPVKKVYYHFTKIHKEAEDICESLGAIDADACITPEGQVYISAGTASSKQFTSGGEIKKASLVESSDGGTQPIVYNFTVTYPENCFSRDNHEILHFFDYQSYGNVAPEWFEEGLVRLLARPILNQSCSPGLIFSNISKKEGGVVTTLTDFDLDSLDLEEPLSAGLAGYADGNQCRKGIYMQIARNIKEGGTVYIKNLYKALQKTKPTSESTAARAVWESSGKDKQVKQFLNQNECSF